ncbi:MAG: 5-(carboxyamino)imidazole ribonucleotide mutase [Deltaproteobacteria bacterium]|nr:5-(carboxyamino)imidazole ribonucleotide mutase [Deltaproteobacteria bacterium]
MVSEKKALIGVLMGSTSDFDVMKGCTDLLDSMDIPYEVKVLSAHRTPGQARDYVSTAMDRGIDVIIAGAGWAAHLAGFVAAHTTLPVIGIPIDSSPLNGMDALFSTVQMPPGIPVATVSVGKGGAKNAAVLAAEILALKHPAISDTLRRYRADLTTAASEKIDSWPGFNQ